jgi:hypothetical protein
VHWPGRIENVREIAETTPPKLRLTPPPRASAKDEKVSAEVEASGVKRFGGSGD